MPTATSIARSSIAKTFLAEFETQVVITHRYLQRLPEDKLTWKPHERSMTAGQLALHLASVPGGVARLVLSNPAQAPSQFVFLEPSSAQEVLDKLEESICTVRETLPQFDDEAMKQEWCLMAGDKELISQPRMQFLRDVMFSHWYQHRGQFSVYLRMLNIPVPASWGPSGDEPPLFMQRIE